MAWRACGPLGPPTRFAWAAGHPAPARGAAGPPPRRLACLPALPAAAGDGAGELHGAPTALLTSLQKRPRQAGARAKRPAGGPRWHSRSRSPGPHSRRCIAIRRVHRLVRAMGAARHGQALGLPLHLLLGVSSGQQRALSYDASSQWAVKRSHGDHPLAPPALAAAGGRRRQAAGSAGWPGRWSMSRLGSSRLLLLRQPTRRSYADRHCTRPARRAVGGCRHKRALRIAGVVVQCSLCLAWLPSLWGGCCLPHQRRFLTSAPAVAGSPLMERVQAAASASAQGAWASMLAEQEACWQAINTMHRIAAVQPCACAGRAVVPSAVAVMLGAAPAAGSAAAAPSPSHHATHAHMLALNWALPSQGGSCRQPHHVWHARLRGVAAPWQLAGRCATAAAAGT